MKLLRLSFIFVCLIGSAFAWDCTVPGQIRVQVASNYTGNGVGDGNNQVVSQGGLNFACQYDPAAPSNTNNSTSSSTATGGSANQHQGQQQSQSNTSTNTNSNSNQSAGGSVSNVGNSVTDIPRQAPPALGPTIFPSGCNGSLSGGASAPIGGISIGGTKQDHHCQQMQTAAMFISQGNIEAAARILCRTWAARDAKLSLEDCKLIARAPLPPPPVELPRPEPARTEIQNNIPAPQIILLEQPITVTPTPQQMRDAGLVKPVVKKKVVHHQPCRVTPLQDSQCPVKPLEK